MSTPNPLVPQGSIQQQSASRNRTRMLVFGVIAVHVVALGGLLFQGCSKPTDAGTTAGTETPGASAAPLGDAGLIATNDPFAVSPVATSTVPSIPVNNTAIPGAPSYAGQPGMAPAPTGAGQLPPAAGLGAPATPGYVPPAATSVPPTPDAGFAPAPAVVTPDMTSPLTASEGSDYVIKKGDTLGDVAKRNKVTLKALEAANPGLDSRKLKIGQKIKIPAGGKSAAAPASSGNGSPAAATEVGSYKVKKGDTLTSIAKKHSTTLKELRRLNGLKTDQIKIDQTLKVPVKAAPAPAPAPAPEPAPVVPPYVPPASTVPVTGNPGVVPGTLPPGRP